MIFFFSQILVAENGVARVPAHKSGFSRWPILYRTISRAVVPEIATAFGQPLLFDRLWGGRPIKILGGRMLTGCWT